MEKIDYSDSTPDVTFDSYDQLGRVIEVSDAVGTRTFIFNSTNLTLTTEAINTSGGGHGAALRVRASRLLRWLAREQEGQAPLGRID